MGVKLGDLEILDMVATGGMAEVYRARINDRLYAVKKILPQFTREKDLVQMFMDEARVAQLLKHPNIITVLDLLLSDAGELFIAMEYADGRDLADVLYAASIKGIRVAPALATYVAREVLHALEYAHVARDRDGRPMQLIHRDISPHNVMLGFDGWVKLMDFGIAKVAFSGHQTMAGVVKGKFGYMSPEQARGKKLDGRSDLYNVGILLYEMITGERLFTGSSDISTLDRMRSAEVPALPPVLRCPPDLEAAIRRSLSKGPDERFPDATSFELALGQVSARNGYVTGPGDAARLVRELFGPTRLSEPPPPSGRRNLIPVQSPIAKTPADSPLLTAAPPAVTAERLKSVVMGGRRVTLLSEAAAKPVAAPQDAAGQTEMLDPSMVPELPPRVDEDGSEATHEQNVFNAPSSVRLRPVTQAPSAPLSKNMDKQDERGVFDSAPPPPPPPPPVARRTTSQDRAPVSGIRSSLPSIPVMPAAESNPAARSSMPRLPAVAPAAPGPAESTRFDAPPSTRPDQRRPTGQQPQAMVPQAPSMGSGIVTKASLQALPSGPPRTNSSSRMPLVPGPASAPPAAPPRTKSLPRLPAVQSRPPAEEPKRPSARSVVWNEPSLEEESRRVASGDVVPPRKVPPPSRSGVDPSAVTGEVIQPRPSAAASVSPGSETAMFMNDALAAADGLLGAPPPPAPPASDEDDKERKKREALERLKAKKAAKAAGQAPPEFAREAPSLDAVADGEDDRERKKREALERLKAKKAAKAAGLPPPEFATDAHADGEAPPAPAAPPADEDEKARKKREALERIKAKKAAKAAGEGGAPPDAAEGVSDALPKAPEGEWRTTPQAPASAPHPARAGKVLTAPVETYDADARPMARRGAWIIGEPAISAGTQRGAARQGLAKTVLPGTLRRRAVVVFAAAAVGFYLLAAQKPQLLAKGLGKLAPMLLAGVSNVPAPPSNTVSLTVRTGPPGCKLWIDGEPVEGESPLTVHQPLTVGAHKVLAVKGKQRKEASFSVAEGQRMALVTVPVVADGEVDVALDEPGTTVWLDGRLMGPAPRKLTELSRDRARHLQIRLGDRVLADQRLPPDRPARLVVDPEAGLNLVSPVVVTSYPPAFLSLGKQDLVHTTGVDPLKLPPGKQTLTLRIPALGITRELALETGGRAPRKYHVELLD